MYRNLAKIGTVPARLCASRRESEFSQTIDRLATRCHVEVETPSHWQCCLDEVAAPVGQESLASGSAGGRGRSRLNGGAGGRSTGSETAGRSRSAGDGNAGVRAGGGNSSGLSRGALCTLTVAVAGGLGLGSALE